MSQVKQNLIRVNLKAGNFTLAAKLALIVNVEQDGRGVFLDNAYSDVSSVMTRQDWRQALSALALQGFYRASQDPEFVGKFGYIDQSK